MPARAPRCPRPTAGSPSRSPGVEPGEPRWVEFDVDRSTGAEAPDSVEPPADSLPRARGGAWLVRERDGSLIAFVPYCTHKLCRYDWDQTTARFACRCHAATFTVESTVISGPPPRPLWRYETLPAGNATIELGWVDRS